MDTEPDFADMARRLHQKIKAVLCSDDMEKVAEFLRVVYHEGKNTYAPIDPYKIREVPAKSGRAWVTGG